jgi:glutamate racemase
MASPLTALVFDSGVGGLSIAAEIQKKLPFLRIIYASDNAFFPYGTKGEDELIDRVEKVLTCITQQHQVDMIVIACNTASTLALPHCRKIFPQPIVGVVPAIKPASQLTRTGVVGLLATPATVARPYTLNLIQEHAATHQVLRLGSSELVSLAEQQLRGESIQSTQLDPILSQFFKLPNAKMMDTLVLACTHFPLLRTQIQEWFVQQQMDVLMIDSGEAIARRVEYLMHELANNSVPSAPEHLALFTQETADIDQLKPALARYGFHRLDFIHLANKPMS